MLVHLHVKNLALIAEAEVSFGPGLNILTGETGAGKSILLGSMQLILGSKISRSMIRDPGTYALVELLFEVENEKALKELRAMDIEPEDGQVLLSRKITGGRSVSKINGETCTVSQMKAAASCLLDIHGQHEHQSLLYRDRQLEILDAFAQDTVRPLAEKTAESFRALRESRKALSSLTMDQEQRAREMAFLEYEIQEIEQADLKPGEDEELEKRYRKLSNSRRMMETLSRVRALTGYEQGASEQTGEAVHEMAKILQFDEDLQDCHELLVQADALLSDFGRELSSYMDDLVFDEETYYETEKRLDLINGLKSRFGQSIPDILAYRDRQAEKYALLADLEKHLAQAQRKAQEAKDAYDKAAAALSAERKKAASELEKQVIRSCKDLNFLDVRFSIRFDEKNESADGTDDVEYEISTNPGEEIRPLGEIVSGGELSRIMLALKTILADRDQIDTLIFDEIDTGISGRTAQKVSEKMAQIARHRQVICITHLPQIAAMADQHYEIEKHGDEVNGTETQIHLLDAEESVRELARLLGGASITPAVLQNAREMRAMALEQKG